MGAFGSKVEMDALAEYTRHHRTRRPPPTIDDNPDQTAEISFQEFYRKEMCLVLDFVSPGMRERSDRQY